MRLSPLQMPKVYESSQVAIKIENKTKPQQKMASDRGQSRSILTSVYQFWANIFWVPKLRRINVQKSLKPGLKSIILSQSFH